MLRAAEGRNRGGEGKPARRASVQRTEPVRLTVDMAPPLHRQLKRWTAVAADKLDVADVPAAKVVRVLVARLTAEDADEEFTQAVLADLRELLAE